MTNAFGDALEIETLARDRVRLSKANTERTTILSSTDGLKVWDFGTIHDLESYLISSGITELLVRSGLMANEKACKCGKPMNLRLRTPMRCDVSNAPSNTETDNYVGFYLKKHGRYHRSWSFTAPLQSMSLNRSDDVCARLLSKT
ncbi:hypothetical protein AAVH_28601 [Aphelenchoides avenae]|nr:hypothetical protein AAVH_28601 [Aphelenchus avenae]